MKVIAALLGLISYSSALHHLHKHNTYCDEWTKCPVNQVCSSKQCVPATCTSNENCPSGYICADGSCFSGTQSTDNGPYCDAYTPCSSSQQCVNKQCVPFTCKNSLGCASGYQCYEGHCIQVSSGPGGRYCDDKN